MPSAWHQRWRKAALEILGGRCVICGETDWMVLQIDHVKGGGSSHRASEYGTNPGKYYKHVISEADSGKFQLLCANCNQRKKYLNNELGGGSRRGSGSGSEVSK